MAPRDPSPAIIPPSLIKALPCVESLIDADRCITLACKTLEREIARAEKAGAVPLARSFAALHRLKKRLEESLKPVDEAFESLKSARVPAAFETSGIGTSLPIAEGFRIGVSQRLWASIKPDCKEEAFGWLRTAGLGSLVTETVNASTLSATAKVMLEEQNRELPDDLFQVAYVPNTSVTVLKSKKEG